MLFTNVSDLLTYLPASGPAGPLTADVVNPSSTPAGEFGGAVIALRLNIDFSDAGITPGTSGLKFGDLILYNLDATPFFDAFFDGRSVREFIAYVNSALGGFVFGIISITDLDNLTLNLTAAFNGGTPSQWAQEHLKRPVWKDGDFVTYSQDSWGGDPAQSPAATLLQANYSSVYASTGGLLEVGVPGAGGYSMIWTNVSDLLTYLPATGTSGPLTSDLLDPSSSESGAFGGRVTALHLNIDFSAAGTTGGSSGLHFGDLTLCGFTTLPGLNGLTVSQFEGMVDTLLGGGSAAYTIADLDLVVDDLDDAFGLGTASRFAQAHLINGPCPPPCGNQCPTASPLSVSTAAGSTVSFQLQGSDADNDPLTYTISQNPTHGTATTSSSGAASYTPAAGYVGPDQFKYKVSDGQCDAEATVSVTVIACPQGQGSWKNNPSAWPVTSLTLGSQTYTQAELLNILNTPIGTGPKADTSLILADQLIAAKLNIAHGTPAAPVAATIADADALLSTFSGKLPYKVRTNSTIGKAMVADGSILESFNKGRLTSGCTY